MPRTFALARSLAYVFFVSAMLPASGRGQDISLAKTVGTVPATCAATTSIAVPVGTTVYYCYRVTNSGSTVFNFHDLVDSDLGTLLTDHPEVLGAGASVEFIQSAVPAATVTNTGPRAGAEVVQLYTRDLVGSETRPVKELKGFRKIELQPGESREVVFPITSADLAYFTPRGIWEAEPGEFQVFVGNSSEADQPVTFTLRAE